MRTEFLASSHMSQLDIFQTCVAMLYSSMRGSLVKWNWRGSSVESDTFKPLARKSGRGDLEIQCCQLQLVVPFLATVLGLGVTSSSDSSVESSLLGSRDTFDS